jgi:carboxylesterase
MVGAAVSVLAALAVVARAIYPRYFEHRALRRRPLGDDGIVRGAGPIAHARPGAPGALLLHGAGDTPQVLAELAGYLHQRGFSVRVPLLASHGRRLEELASASAAGWYNDARDALREMRATHDWVAVVGLSMGGALAIRLAAEEPEIPALVLLAPYIAMAPLARRAAGTSRAWGWLLPYFSSFGARSIHDAAAATRGLGHGILTPATLRALRDVVHAANDALPKVSCPTLVVQSREDNRISVASATEAFGRLGAAEKELVWTEGAGHVITVDFGREHVFDLTARWLAGHGGAARLGARR